MRNETTGQATVEPVMLDRRSVWQLTGAGLTLIGVCYGLGRFAYGLFVPVFREEFTLTPAVAGTVASGAYIAYCIAIIFATLLTPRLGGQAVAVSAGCIAAVGTLTVALAPNAIVLAAGVLVAGASTGVASPPLAYAVARHVPEARRDRVQTVINAGTGVGVAVAGPVALLTHEHWRLAWVAFAVLCTLVTVWNLRMVPGRTRGEPREAASAFLPRPLFPAGSVRLMGGALLMGISSAAVWTFGRDLLVTEGEMSEPASMIGWIILGTFGILGAGAGDLARVVGIRAGWLATMILLGASTALLALLPGNVLGAWTALAIFGASYIVLTGLMLVWTLLVYAQTPAAGVGLSFLTVALGQAVAAPAIGALSELTGAPGAFIAMLPLAIVGGLCRPAPMGA